MSKADLDLNCWNIIRTAQITAQRKQVKMCDQIVTHSKKWLKRQMYTWIEKDKK